MDKRYLNEQLIRQYAKINAECFEDFEEYMVSADIYLIDTSKGDWAEKIHRQFCEAEPGSEARRALHQKIVNNEI